MAANVDYEMQQVNAGGFAASAAATAGVAPPHVPADLYTGAPQAAAGENAHNHHHNGHHHASHMYPTKKKLGDVVLRLDNISKSFTIEKSTELVVALKDISLNEKPNAFPPIRKGEFVMIRGPSGGGKTTMLNIIGTLDAPTTGTVELMGQVVDPKSSDDYLAGLRLRHIGVVFQTFNLIATMTALENVELPMTLLGDLNDKDRRRRAKQLLALVGLRNRQHHLPSELSGGEQQRVTIARALANNPTVLLLDEPTGDLDTATTIDVMNLLMEINHTAETTCIMVTHNPDVECYADRILYVSDGRFVKQAINSNPQRLVYEKYQKYLLERDQQLTTRLAPQISSGEADAAAGGAAAPRIAIPHQQPPQQHRFTAADNSHEENVFAADREQELGTPGSSNNTPGSSSSSVVKDKDAHNDPLL